MPEYPSPFQLARMCVAVAIFCSLLIAAPFEKKKKQKPSVQKDDPSGVVMPDMFTAAEGGQFAFRSLHLVQQRTLLYIAGTLTNETTHPWEDVSFDFQFTDSDGRTGSLGKVFCPIFPVHGECSLALDRSMPGMMLTHAVPQNLRTVGFVLTTGRYLPHYTFSLQKPRWSEALAFEDASIAFFAQVTRDGVEVAIVNRTDQPIKIDWNQVSYVDHTGRASAVSHAGVKYLDAAGPKAPTVIPPAARHEDLIVPSVSIRYSERKGWIVDPLLPMGESSRDIVGSVISLFMPMEIAGKIENYTFAIKIESVD